MKNSKAHIESVFYEWLLSELSPEEKTAFCQTLDTLYWKCKLQRRAGFVDVTDYLTRKNPPEERKEADNEAGKISAQ